MAEGVGEDGQEETKEVAPGLNQVIRAAGGVLWRLAPGGAGGEPVVEVAVIRRPRYGDWTIPKGKLARGEGMIEGAVREVLEETGFRVRVGRSLGESRYMKETARGMQSKVVRYWAMEAAGGTFVPGREVDELRWVSLAQAHDLLSYERDKRVLDRFARGPGHGSLVLLVRHASAGSRSQWDGPDKLRPLDEGGRERAEALVRPLASFGVNEIISADYLRCEQTVQPLAEALGLKPRSDPLLSEEGYPGHEGEAIALVRSCSDGVGTTVLCSQGGVIPDLLGIFAGEDHVDLPANLDPRKGSVCTLTFDEGRLQAVDYLPPPG